MRNSSPRSLSVVTLTTMSVSSDSSRLAMPPMNSEKKWPPPLRPMTTPMALPAGHQTNGIGVGPVTELASRLHDTLACFWAHLGVPA